ncbi:MAG: glycosyltransferase [Spirochaetia bacterium]
MKILIDIQPCQNRRWEIGRYSLSLVTALLSANKKHEFHILMNGAFCESVPELRHRFSKWIPLDHTHVFFPIGDVNESEPRNAWRNQASIEIRQALIGSIGPDCVFVLSLFEGYTDNAVVSIQKERSSPVVCMLYDLILSLKAEMSLKDTLFTSFYNRKVEELARAEGLLGISNHVVDQAVERLHFDRKKTAVIGAGCDQSLTEASNGYNDSVLDRLGISRNFVLCAPAKYAASKQMGRLFIAWARLPKRLREKYQLIVEFGTDDQEKIRRLARKAGLSSGEYGLTGKINDGDIVSLYRAGTLIVFLDVEQGFVLPIMETMACGATFLSPNSKGLERMRINENALFNPKNTDRIARLLRHCLEEKEFRVSLKSGTLLQETDLTWEDAAAASLEFFNEMEERLIAEAKNQQKARSIDLDTEVEFLSRIPRRGSRPDLRDYAAAAVSLASLVMRPGKPRLYIDISMFAAQDLRTGTHRVVRAMLRHLPNIMKEKYDAVPVYGDESGKFKQASRWLAEQTEYHSLQKAGGDDVIDARKGDIMLGLDLSVRLYPLYAPEIARLRAIGVKVYFVVYDLIPLTNPDYFEDALVKEFNIWIHSITPNTDGFFCISKAVSQEMRNWMVANYPEYNKSLRIEWFHLGADIASSKHSDGISFEASQVLGRLMSNPSFLMVGTLEPRKGHTLVLDEFELLWHQGNTVNLVLVGRLGWKMEGLAKRLLEHPERNKRLFWLDRVSDDYLDKIYSASTALIAASEAEGFGLPIIEAAQKGIWVVARDIPVFREVGRDGAIYFDGNRSGSLSELIGSMIQGSPRIYKPAKFSWLTWEESARKLSSLLLS